ncbi:hypothetical protein LOK49_LG02G03238 [Camellia lanceoleosa]|uniref:Uncharacterized protein n=1 Tax=Camellia lanceoleosa TaxID=1840588 RepID=A0ACC0IUC0_9ERIC|nr:hypothetical protein LOK49_LG02G03238 [Camellia lanceoleosa]
MLSTIATGLAIDAYGPIGDNLWRNSRDGRHEPRIRERTDALIFVGNTTSPSERDLLLDLFAWCHWHSLVHLAWEVQL